MVLDLKTLEKTVAVAHLGSDSVAGLLQELAGLFQTVEVLNEADLAGLEAVEPLYSPLEETAGPRPDEPGPGAEPEELLKQAPERVGRFFAVPKII